MDTLFATILDDGHNIVGAEKCSLFFVDEEKEELWTKVATDNDGEIKVSSGFADISVDRASDEWRVVMTAWGSFPIPPALFAVFDDAVYCC